jgi:predicted small lipoprotein YifL
MRRIVRTTSAALLALAATFTLGACGDKPQEATAVKSGKYAGKPDTPPWQGDALVFSARDFKQGDRESWDSALRARAQAQNEYNRTP